MVTWDKETRVPVIIQTGKGSVDITIPDLEMTVHGTDYLSAIALAVLRSSAVYYYNLEHNLPTTLNHSYAEVERMALKKGKGAFATLLRLSE